MQRKRETQGRPKADRYNERDPVLALPCSRIIDRDRPRSSLPAASAGRLVLEIFGCGPASLGISLIAVRVSSSFHAVVERLHLVVHPIDDRPVLMVPHDLLCRETTADTQCPGTPANAGVSPEREVDTKRSRVAAFRLRSLLKESGSDTGPKRRPKVIRYDRGKTMSKGQKSMTTAQARGLLAQGWKLTQESMVLIGMPVPDLIEFQIEGAKQIRATRVAKLDELTRAIGALEEDIARLAQGAPALVFITRTSSGCDRKGTR
jgi:hypothetical protein